MRRSLVSGLVIAVFAFGSFGARTAHSAAHVVATNGVTLSSSTVGLTWNAPVVIDPAVSFFGVWFLDESIGIAVGNGATIRRTANGGTTWDLIAPPIQASFSDVMFPDATTGYIAAGNGQVLKSVNAGANWVAQDPGSGAGFNTIWFLTPSTGWAAGTAGAVSRTTNGGTNWNTAFVSPVQTLNDIFFIDASNGWAVGTGGSIYRSTNGGSSWNAQTSGTTVDLTGVWFTSATLGFACGGDRLLLKTTNGGTNWNPVTLPTTNQQSGLFDLMFAGPDSGIVVGSGVNAYRTIDGGTNWTVANPDPSPEVWQAIHLTRPPGPNAITVSSNPVGRSFTVDGQVFTTTQNFSWAAGSSHTISTTSPQSNGAGSQYAFANWSTGQTTTSITVVPTGPTTFTANFTLQYQLTMSNGGRGTVSPASGFKNAGSVVAISATDPTGYNFDGWTGTGTISFTGATRNVNVTMNSPITETANWVPETINVTIASTPTARSVIVDGTTFTTPHTFTYTADVSHTLEAVDNQAVAAGSRDRFASWSDGGARVHTIDPLTSQTITATFQRQYFLDTSVGAGSGTVNPADSWHDAGSTFTLSATPAAGQFLYFLTGTGTGSFSGFASTASLTMNNPMTEQGFFSSAVPRNIVVNATPTTRTIQANGLSFTGAVSFDWPSGLALPINAPTPQNVTANVKRYLFNDWSDGGAAQHTVTPAANTTYTAHFKAQFTLTMSAQAGGTTTPAPGISWFDSSSTPINFTATPDGSHTFAGWTGTGTGAYTGFNNPGSVKMVNAITEAAAFAFAPALAVLSPNGGERLQQGVADTITWSSNFGGNVRIQYQIGAASAVTLSASTPNDGAFEWIPPNQSSGLYRILIADAADGTPSDQSDGPFTVCDPMFTTVTPAQASNGVATDAASADFNEDGIADLVETVGTAISVQTGSGAAGVGDGGFVFKIALAGDATALRHPLVADVNEDGRQDVLALSAGGNLVRWLGTGTGAVGNGSFGAPATFPTGGAGSDLDVGDFNEDGILDAVVTDATNNRVALLQGLGANGTGSGGFGAASFLFPALGASAVKVCDLDEDSRLDLIVANSGDVPATIAIYRGLGTGIVGNGTFAAPQKFAAGGGVGEIALGDFNEDGRTDLATIDPAGSKARVLLANGVGSAPDGTFGAAVSYDVAVTPSHIALGDFERNGRGDLAVSSTAGDAITILSGNGTGSTGDGTFAPLPDLPARINGGALVLGDFLEDNRLDVLGVEPANQGLTLFAGSYAFCGGSAAAVSVVAPNTAGLSFPIGQEISILWIAGGAVQSVDVDVSRDNGTVWEPVIRGAFESQLTWTVTPPAAATCLLRVRDSAIDSRVDVCNFPFAIVAPTVGVGGVPLRASLSAAWPNPARARTQFTLALPANEARATLVVFDLAGRKVKTLVDGPLPAGEHVVAWDGRDGRGAKAPAGIYFARGRWGAYQGERRIVLLP